MSLKLIGKKRGMTRVFDETGSLIVCTVISVEPNVVVQVKDGEKDGYRAVQLGGVKVSESKKRNVKKPLVGHFAKAKVEPRCRLFESRVDGLDEYEVGKEISLDYFSDTQYVDVIGTSKGKGFQGVIKRHGYGGGPAAHGSGFHRTAGSTGMCSTPGRCLPGRRMAGQMGAKRSISMNLKVIQVDSERQFLLVKGAVPGARNGLVYVRKSIKKHKVK